MDPASHDPCVVSYTCTAIESASFFGGKEFRGAWIEWKVPSFAFNDRVIQQGFFKDATEIIHALSGGRQPRENIYVNVVHTVDGAWNLDGQAMTNQQLGEAIAKG
ncbi:MAG: 4-oxalocrotonate tautomerase [Candidatus Thiodiazotropha sp. (ex Dulcina madagascariensis)]|nr:4-oxalocrotonate tautomerase [Candidatus Thiodiazotropha sp. (ex Dulcina madagascariensis)]